MISKKKYWHSIDAQFCTKKRFNFIFCRHLIDAQFCTKKRFNFIFCRHSIFPRSFDLFLFFFHPLILYWFETEFYNLFQFAFYMVIVVLKKHSVIWLMLKFTKKEINFIICKFSLFLRPFIFFSYLILCWLRIEFL